MAAPKTASKPTTSSRSQAPRAAKQRNRGTLPAGVYIVPDGFRAVLSADSIEIRPVKGRSRRDRYCVDCIHCVKGWKSPTAYYRRDVCELRPKAPRCALPDDRQCYYAVQRYDAACTKFNPRTTINP